MTDYKIAPLTWLDTKYSKINHVHELYEEKEIERITEHEYYSDTYEMDGETITNRSYFDINGIESVFTIENFSNITGNKEFITINVDGSDQIIIKELNENDVWLYAPGADRWTFLPLEDECNYYNVLWGDVTTEEPENGISKNAKISVSLKSDIITFNIYEDDELIDTIIINYIDDEEWHLYNRIGSVNFTGFIIKDKIKYLEPKIFTKLEADLSEKVIHYARLGQFSKVTYNIVFDEDSTETQNFSFEGYEFIVYEDGWIYWKDPRYQEETLTPIKQDNEITLETILYNYNLIIKCENIILTGGSANDMHYDGIYKELNIEILNDEVGNKATNYEMDNAYSELSNKVNWNSVVTQWNSSVNNYSIPSEKLVKNSLDETIKNIGNKSNRITIYSDDSTYPTSKAVYDMINTKITSNEDIDITDLLDETKYVGKLIKGSVNGSNITKNGTELNFTTTSLRDTLWFENDYVFSDDDYWMMTLEMKKPSGSYGGKDFGIVIGDEQNYITFFFGYYNISIQTNGEEKAKNGTGVSATSYTPIKIIRNGNTWTLDYDNGWWAYTISTGDLDIDNKFNVLDMNWSRNGSIFMNNLTCVSLAKFSALDVIYPIGSIYMNTNNVSPENLFGGEWEQINDDFVISQDYGLTATVWERIG